MAKKLLALIRQRLNITTATGEVTLLENAGHQGIKGMEMEMAEEGITNFVLMAYTSQGSSSSDTELNNKRKVTSQKEIKTSNGTCSEVNHQNKLTHLHPKRNFVPTVVATKSGQVPVNAAKQNSPRATTSISTVGTVNTATPKPKVNDALPITYSYFKAHSQVRRAFNQKSIAKTNNFNEKVNTARVNNVTTAGPKAVVSAAEGNRENDVKSSACWIWRPTGNVIDHTSKDSGSYMLKRFDYGNPQYTLQDQGIFGSRCSRHMTGNKSFLTDYQEINGGFVAFAGSPKGGKITGKGKIRTRKLDFEDTKCLVLSPDFKLLDESQVLLKVPRHDNMYSFDLKNVVPSGGLTCLFAKATIDESNLWHRRLGHINFKTMNKLVRGNLVRGLPSKLFENDHTCVACQKGKQHKASCKTKLVSSISQPLQMLHMDLFGPTSVRSINHKTYCLVVIDDFSRFSWVFFLATKDETSGILKTFITGIENQINHKVKIIRCDNGTEFKNNDMNQFCEMKGIKREFSVARTPQQNRVAERKNRTLIEVARNMLAGSLLPTTFWAEAVNTADSLMPDLEDTADLLNTSIFSGAYDDEDKGVEADLNNLETTMNVQSPYFPPPRIQKDAPKDADYYVKSAFLYGTIKEDVYVCQPPGFEDPQFPDKVYKVEKALYGLHQAPRAWYETLSTYLLENGFRRGTIDKTLFIKKDKGKQKGYGIFNSQDKYVVDIIEEVDFATVKTASTPMRQTRHCSRMKS
ncbi:putative ribonuclease H-like domain-containing protein [Tanacetum coccineum]